MDKVSVVGTFKDAPPELQKAIVEAMKQAGNQEPISVSTEPVSVKVTNPYEDRVFVPADGIVARKLPIILYPDNRLEQVSRVIDIFGSGLDQFAANLVATATAANAAGLAAVQVGVPIHVIAVRVAEEAKFVVMVNPQILHVTHVSPAATFSLVEEGCLSFPGVKEKVERYNEVRVIYQDLKGVGQEMDLTIDSPETYTAGQAVQHEVEHLEGKLLTSHLNIVHRDRLRLHMKQVHRKLAAISEKSRGKVGPMQALFGYIPDPAPVLPKAE